MALLALAAAAVLGLTGGDDVLSGLPRSVAQAEQPQPRPESVNSPSGEGHDFFTFGPLQASARVGFIAFSEDFESDPQFLAGIGARVDWTWLSQDVFGFDKDRLGIFLNLSFSKIERDLDFLADDSGTLIFVDFGLDLNVYEDETFVFRAQAGGQYGHFGGVDETDNGVAGLVGLDLGVKIAGGVALVVNPQMTFGHAGDQIYFVSLGLQVTF